MAFDYTSDNESSLVMVGKKKIDKVITTNF